MKHSWQNKFREIVNNIYKSKQATINKKHTLLITEDFSGTINRNDMKKIIESLSSNLKNKT